MAAVYGLVSAVTSITETSYLEMQNITLNDHTVAIMSLEESPSIIVGFLLISTFDKPSDGKLDTKQVIHHSLTNGSVLVILGSFW